MGRQTKYNEEVRCIISDAIRQGKSYREACVLGGITDTTFERWRKEKVDFVEAIKKAEADYHETYAAETLALCKKSLRELITGGETAETKTVYENDAHGNPRIKQQIVTKKNVAPNPTAIIFAITNLDPEHWKNRQTSENKIELDKINDSFLKGMSDADVVKLAKEVNKALKK